MRFPRPCVKCNRLHRDPGDYCISCRTELNRIKESNPDRIARKRMLYSNGYPARRARMVAETIERNLNCHICNKPFESKSDITADHLLAGNPNSPLAPAHKACNSSRGNTPLL